MLMRSSNSSRLYGLLRKSSAPSLKDFSFSLWSVVRTMIGMSLKYGLPLICASASKPSITGMCKSNSTTSRSGLNSSTSRASLPLAAAVQSAPLPPSAADSMSRLISSSSTTNTLVSGNINSPRSGLFSLRQRRQALADLAGGQGVILGAPATGHVGAHRPALAKGFGQLDVVADPG